MLLAKAQALSFEKGPLLSHNDFQKYNSLSLLLPV